MENKRSEQKVEIYSTWRSVSRRPRLAYESLCFGAGNKRCPCTRRAIDRVNRALVWHKFSPSSSVRSRGIVRFTHVERFLIYSTELIFLHLFIPAIFKSLIFIRVGRYIHTVAYINRNQDVRLYYGLYYIYPLKRIIVIFSILCGFPFLVGYYSKDLIIEYFFLEK